LGDLDALIEVKVAKLSEVRHMIETQSLYSKALGSRTRT